MNKETVAEIARKVIGNIKFSKRSKIHIALTKALKKESAKWGVEINRVEIELKENDSR